MQPRFFRSLHNLLIAVVVAMTFWSPASAADPVEVNAAIESVYAGADYQRSLPGVQEPEPTTTQDDELPEPIQLDWLADILEPLSYILLAAAVIFVIVTAYRALEKVRLRPRRTDRHGTDHAEYESLHGSTVPAATRFGDAEALAKQGAFAEAIHILLLAVVDAMRSRASQEVMPALTARELVRRVTLDEPRRQDFAGLVERSERGHFGGRVANRLAFDDCLQRAHRLVDAMAGA